MRIKISAGIVSVSFFIQTGAIAASFGLADAPFVDVTTWKRTEIKELRIADYSITWGESNPPLVALIQGEKPQLSPTTSTSLSIKSGVTKPEPPPFPVDKSIIKVARTKNKSCTSNYITSDTAQYRSQTICTTQVADRNFVRGNGYTVTGSVANIEFGVAPDNMSFMAIYSTDGKLRHLIHIISYLE